MGEAGAARLAQGAKVRVRRIILSLAALVAVGAAVPPALEAVGAHSAPLAEAPFRDVPAAPAPAHFADAAIGREWTSASVPAP